MEPLNQFPIAVVSLKYNFIIVEDVFRGDLGNIPPVIETGTLDMNARRRFGATSACDISDMVYKLVHWYIPLMFIGQNEKSLELVKNNI